MAESEEFVECSYCKNITKCQVKAEYTQFRIDRAAGGLYTT